MVTLSTMPGLPALYGRAVRQSLRRALPRPTGLGSGTLRPAGPHGGGAADPGPGDDRAPTELRVERVPLSADRLAGYRDVCGFSSEPAVPATYPHVLAFPLHLMLMTRAAFPFPALGAVHVANSIVQERALTVGDVLDLTVFATGERPHRRGRQATLVTQARVADCLAWRAESVFLHRDGSAATGPASDQLAPPRGEDTSMGESGAGAASRLAGVIGPVRWHVPGDVGRRYAAVSGDRNPIHLYDATAKPFGFSRHIAHGMWTTARVLAQLADRLPDRFRCDVAFKRPLSLPATVQFEARDTGTLIDFDVMAASGTFGSSAAGVRLGAPPTANLVGTLTPL